MLYLVKAEFDLPGHQADRVVVDAPTPERAIRMAWALHRHLCRANQTEVAWTAARVHAVVFQPLTDDTLRSLGIEVQ